MATKKKKKSPAKSKHAPPKKAAAAKRAPKQTKSKRATKKAKTSSGKKAKGARTKSRKPARRNLPRETAGFDRNALESRSGMLSGDLQGMRNTERADSESVSDLLEEGNAFEAGIVTGVEEAEDNPEKEVQTREVPEDDVPEEYLDEE